MITKKLFKELCSTTTYSGGGTRYNAIFYDYQDRAWKYMVWANTKDMTKKDLFNEFYEWLKENEGKEPNLNGMPWYVNLKYAPTDEKRFKIPIGLR
jgi:hypothetical protein